ncbi:hypothetical protein BT69DRAFT_1083398 [Atractiella rhizophila]|nr:hypothetical protein BT69DRAFT_1083398 [Atractiella rhizophila]
MNIEILPFASLFYILMTPEALDQPSRVVYDSQSPNMSNDSSYPLRSAPDVSTTVSNDGTVCGQVEAGGNQRMGNREGM